MKIKCPQGFLALSLLWAVAVQAQVIYDKARDRAIPLEIAYPIEQESCTVTRKCKVAFLSAGYGVSPTKYSFLVTQLNALGYMVVTIAHELPHDPPLSVTGNLYATRSENWARGADTLHFIKRQLQSRYPNYDFNALLLVGHSNGGDISAWLAHQKKPYITFIITLDHRRVPLPRTKKIGILSIRASDFVADDGVLPTDAESAMYSSCVVTIPQSKHNDMSDDGPAWLKAEIVALVKKYLTEQSCALPGNA
jgi:hypothetical protein